MFSKEQQEKSHKLLMFIHDMAIADHGMIPREEMLQITKYCGISLSKLYRVVDDFKGQYAPNAWENAEKVYHRHRNCEDVLKPKK